MTLSLRVRRFYCLHPTCSRRTLAVRFTDERRYFVSEATVCRFLKAQELITSTAYFVVEGADEFRNKTTLPNQLWQTDFTFEGGRLTGMASDPDRRVPASSASAMSISVCASAKRSLRCALAQARPETGATKMRRGQWLQRKWRTFTRHVIERSRQGSSFRVRQYELCTRVDQRPQCGQAARDTVMLAVIVSASASNASSSTCTHSETEGIDGLESRIARSLGHHKDQRSKALSIEQAEEHLFDAD